MASQLQQLKERILGNKSKKQATDLTNILDMVREFSCLGEIMGRDFEIRDPKGTLLYVIHQKPMAIKQMNTLLKEFASLKRIDHEREAAKWGGKGGGKPGRRGK